ncbi:hypothetical protein [Psychromonas aquimarina]|uniref:hypothetical protein n=1 Tax=Psychromonas aquimarina TaxID=444919 RepID=UPI0012FB8F51|nr:hypothetical protein [Psychromonas aquimarina]
MTDIKITDCGDYSQIQITSEFPEGKSMQYAELDQDTFISKIKLPEVHEYTDYFKKRLYQLSIDGIVKPESLAQHHRNLEQDNRLRSGSLKRSAASEILGSEEIKQYALCHHRISDGRESFLKMLNHFLKRQKIRITSQNNHFIYDAFTINRMKYEAGHRVIYKEFQGKRYYLDICEYGNDEYLKQTAPKYIAESPMLFS